jgi:hypothetical protein
MGWRSGVIVLLAALAVAWLVGAEFRAKHQPDDIYPGPGVTEVNVEIVWDPPWDQGRMSEAARLQLGMV